MSEMDAELVPWELVVEFSSLDEILNLRLVSRSMADCMSQISPFKCASLLQKRLTSSQVSLVSNGSWKKPCQDYVAFLTRPETSALDTLIRTMRAMQCLPTEMAIAYSGKYGRHAIPLKFNQERKSVEVFSYPECRRRNCPSCRMRIPHDASGDAEIYNFITIRHKKHRFDLTKFYPKCMPNLPADLCCPHCRSGERTLVLSMLSYESASVDNKSLTFTPKNDQDFFEAESEDDEEGIDDGGANEEDNGDDPPDRKRARLDDTVADTTPTDSFSFPLIHGNDIALPHRDGPKRAQDNSKFAIAIHCTSCQEFGVVAPASPCLKDEFACHHVAESMQFADRTSTVGAVLVRNTCAHCDKATLCTSCCLRDKHRPYASDVNQEEPVFLKYWCKHCHASGEEGIHCPTCAWMTTVCHHW